MTMWHNVLNQLGQPNNFGEIGSHLQYRSESQVRRESSTKTAGVVSAEVRYSVAMQIVKNAKSGVYSQMLRRSL